jgi:hypothetical protein
LPIFADPVARWVYPESDQYLASFFGRLREFGGRAFEQDTARSVNDCADVALWLPPGVEPDEAALADSRATVRGGRHF